MGFTCIISFLVTSDIPSLHHLHPDSLRDYRFDPVGPVGSGDHDIADPLAIISICQYQYMSKKDSRVFRLAKETKAMPRMSKHDAWVAAVIFQGETAVISLTG